MGVEGEFVQIVDSDISTVVADADKALLLSVADRELLNIEFQSGFESDMIERFLEYSVLFFRRMKLPVRTVVVLLRPQADRETVNGKLEIKDTSGRIYLTFLYEVVRMWEIPVDQILAGGLGTLPLAPLANLDAMSIESVVRRMDARMRSEVTESEADSLWASTYLLMGLRYSQDAAAELVKGVRGMRESVTYQAILNEGREEGKEMGQINEARSLLLRIGTKRLGPPTDATVRALNAINDKTTLEQLVERVLDVETWSELFDE